MRNRRRARRPGPGLRAARFVQRRPALSAAIALAFVLLVPTMVLLGMFIAYPFVLGIWYSLINARIGVPGTFVGLDNFIANAQNGIFQQTLKNTFVYTVLLIGHAVLTTARRKVVIQGG